MATGGLFGTQSLTVDLLKQHQCSGGEGTWRELTYSVDMADEVENIVLVSETLIHLAAGAI